MGILFNHIHQMNAHIKFTMECPDSEGSIPFLDTNCTPYSNHTIHTTVYRKPTHTDRFLDWNANKSIPAKRSVIQALIHRAQMVCCTPRQLPKEMDYLHKVLCRNSYPEWFQKKKKTVDHIWTRPPPKKPLKKPLSQFHAPKSSEKNLEEYLRTLNSE